MVIPYKYLLTNIKLSISDKDIEVCDINELNTMSVIVDELDDDTDDDIKKSIISAIKRKLKYYLLKKFQKRDVELDDICYKISEKRKLKASDFGNFVLRYLSDKPKIIFTTEKKESKKYFDY